MLPNVLNQYSDQQLLGTVRADPLEGSSQELLKYIYRLAMASLKTFKNYLYI